jgi:hypothetical protein
MCCLHCFSTKPQGEHKFEEGSYLLQTLWEDGLHEASPAFLPFL